MSDNWTEWFVPIIIIGIYLFQAFAGSKKKRPASDGESQSSEPPQEQPKDIEDLLEALGKKYEPQTAEEAPPIIQETKAAPPPQPIVQEVVIPNPPPLTKKQPVYSSSSQTDKEESYDMEEHPHTIVAMDFEKEEQKTSPKPYALTREKTFVKFNIRQELRDRENIRKAVVINEILATPPGLKPLTFDV